MLQTITSLHLPYIETANYRDAQKAVFLKKRERLILKRWSISLSPEKEKIKKKKK
jgi:hypothetical protein